ncbi:hypothetical protein BDW02DRAFT_598904 [Decorospora gaudefroyi]|uniref:2EXR domain-containing protein n=1 Tax=Decorospora gaudefroyi TaxID=184978 RepID=A0A6A5KBT4_9PLEO|nr:hypothetical protein BDW02DRAFT_598904 [Decorospora gaudefroyi]
MPVESRLPIFNPHESNQNLTFRLFPSLPKELRLLIWTHALHRQRIINVHLSDPWLENPSTFRDRLSTLLSHRQTTGSSPGGWSARAGHYLITVYNSIPIFSKFLRVCQESRKAAFSTLIFAIENEIGVDTFTTPGTFYFNPEWDFLRITGWEQINVHLHIPCFLHDLKVRYDPRGIGLLNLLISDEDDDDITSSLQDSDMPSDIRNSVASTLRQLHEVFFRSKLTKRRMGFTIADGHLDAKPFFNRSLPLHTNISIFDRFATDPRGPTITDLSKQYMGESKTTPYHRFVRLLTEFGISSSTDTATQFQFMITFSARFRGDNRGADGGVYNREDAQKWLRRDYEQNWVRRSWWPKGVDTEVSMGPDYVMDVLPAFGFWLFPLDAMMDTERKPVERLFDMSQHRPALGLSVM